MARTVQEVLDELFTLPPEDVTTALTNSDHPMLKGFRSKQFSGGKGEGEKALKDLKKAVKEAETLDDVFKIVTGLGLPEETLTALKAQVPDRVAIENEVKGKYEGKLTEAKTKLAKLVGANQGLGRKTALSTVLGYLKASGPDLEALKKKFPGKVLGEVFGKYADTILAHELADRIVVDEEGKITDVLKLGETTGYDAPTIDEKFVLLAADARKQVPTEFVVAGGDKGGGLRGGTSGGSSGTGPSLDKTIEQKRATGTYAL